ncbi:MAG: nucleotide exchange factor GrpE [Candidatus Paceibacterota bacterium]
MTEETNTTNENNEIFEDVTFVDSTEDGDVLPTKDVVKKLREEIKKLRAEKEEYLTGWQRAKADYVNLQKEEEGKRKEMRGFIMGTLVEDLLPVLDSFDMAFANKEAWEKVDPNWRNGVEYIHQQFLRVLGDNNVTPINQTGVSFEPTIHESVETVPTDDQSKDHTIATVIQSGYKMGERVIRPARVKVWEKK